MVCKFMSRVSVYRGTKIYEKTKKLGLIVEDRGIVSYRFKEPIVDRLFSYLSQLISEIDQKYDDAFKNLDFYHDYYITMLHFYKRLAESLKDERFLQVICENLSWFEEKRMLDSYQMDECFAYLLDAFSLSWTYDRFCKEFMEKLSIETICKMRRLYWLKHLKLQRFIAKYYPQNMIF